MKKLISFFLVLVFLVTVSAVSYAEEYNWADIESRASELMGENSLIWKCDEVDAVFNLPYAFSSYEPSEEDKAGGCVGIAISDDDPDKMLLLYYVDAEGVTLDSLYSYYLEDGALIEKVSVNGIPALLQRNEADNYLSLFYITRENKLFQVVFSPLSDESVLYKYVIASFRPFSEEEFADTAVTAVPDNPVSGLISK